MFKLASVLFHVFEIFINKKNGKRKVKYFQTPVWDFINGLKYLKVCLTLHNGEDLKIVHTSNPVCPPSAS